MKESKLGILAESKLGSAVTASSTPASNASATVKAPVSFNFTPLTKPEEDSKQDASKPVDVENKNPNLEESAKEEKFVFGQNLTERVENVEVKLDEKQNESNKQEDKVNKTEEAKTDEASGEPEKKSELLFTNSVSPSSKKPEEEAGVGGNKTLSEAAAEYTENHNSNKRKYDVVDVVTGEETESNVLQANVKLYIFDTDKKNWVERGRGMLRLNDDPSSTLGHLRSVI